MRRLVALLAPLLALAACDAPSPAPTDAAAPTPDATTSDLPFADLVLLDRASPADATSPTVDLPLPPISDAAVWTLYASADDCLRLGGAACFLAPPGPVRTDRGLLTFACRETTPAVTTAASAVNVGVVNFANADPIPGATVTLSPNDDFAPPEALTTAVTNDTGFIQPLTAPPGTPSRAFWRVVADGYLPTYSMSARLDVTLINNTQRLNVISAPLAAVVRHAAGLPPDDLSTTGTIATEVDDCDGHAIENVVITLSTTPSTVDATGTRYRPPSFVSGAKVFYLSDTTPLPLPRADLHATSANGTAVIFDVPPTVGAERFYLQAWGYRADGALRLMGETPVRSIAGAVVLPEMQAFR